MGGMSSDAARIKTLGPGRAEIEVNGARLERVVSGFHLRGGVGEMPTLELELFLSTEWSGPADIRIPDETRAALIALGWTAPEGGEYHDDKTLDRVRRALLTILGGNIDGQHITDLISEMQNEGILFRERVR